MEQLTRLVCVEGKTFAETGRLMGVSKNVVIGKATRLHLVPGQDAPLSEAQRNARLAAGSWGIRTTAQRLAALDRFPPPARCVFPIGHPSESNFRFCGDKVKEIGAPYCGSHHEVAFVPASKTVDALKSINFAAAHLAKQVARG